MKNYKPLKCAVIGVGYLGKFHAQKYAEIENAELVGIADIDQETAQRMATTYGCKAYKDFNDLLPHVDLVSIVVPTELHYKIAKVCLEKGVHVLLEKPITQSVEEADELIRLAEKTQTKLQIGHLERYNPAAIAMKEIISQPQVIQINRMAPFKSRSTDISVILDLMIHDIEMVQYWLQSAVNKITASGIRVLSGKIDFANAVLEFCNGCLVTITASRISTKQERIARIYQNNKYFSVDFMNNALTTFMEIEDDGESTRDPSKPHIKSEQNIFGENDVIKEEIIDFLKSINENVRPTVDGAAARDALKIALDITRLINERHKKHF